MVEVFITNIKETFQAKRILKVLQSNFPKLKIIFDLDDSAHHFPCGHTVLRVEGAAIDSKEIITTVNQSGFLCEVMENKICK